jgi:hypothetical protein
MEGLSSRVRRNDRSPASPGNKKGISLQHSFMNFGYDLHVHDLSLRGVQEEEARRRAGLPTGEGRMRAPEDEDSSSYQKYDAFREMLSSAPLLKVRHRA